MAAGEAAGAELERVGGVAAPPRGARGPPGPAAPPRRPAPPLSLLPRVWEQVPRRHGQVLHRVRRQTTPRLMYTPTVNARCSILCKYLSVYVKYARFHKIKTWHHHSERMAPWRRGASQCVDLLKHNMREISSLYYSTHVCKLCGLG